MTSTKVLIILLVVVVLLAITSAVLGARRTPPASGDPVNQQAELAQKGTGSSLTGIASWFTWAQPAFPLEQVTINNVRPAQRLIPLPAKGTVAITLAKVTGSAVRQLTLALHDPPASAASPLVAITYRPSGTLPAHVSASSLPPEAVSAKSPTLPRTEKPPAAHPDWTCALPIYPDGAVVTLHSESAQALTCEIR